MTIILQPEHDRLIAEALRSGAYQSSEEVIKQALELLHQRDAWLAENRAKIEEGYAAAQRGELIDSDPALELSVGSLEVVPRREAYPVEQTLLILEAC
jgi:antitoxin ParD1/3/4